MSTSAATTARALVAIAGNPNTGKTTLFNRLTGAHHKVGNYPGITVERHHGRVELAGGRSVDVVDVPGAYSLSARSREEELAIQSIAGLSGAQLPDVVVVVVDATQLARNLYLVLQVLELEVPALVALNMSDQLEKRGLEVDEAALARELGVPVVRISALHDAGFEPLLGAIGDVLDGRTPARPGPRWKPASKELREDVAALRELLPQAWVAPEGALAPSDARRDALALWALLSIDEHDELDAVPAEL